MRLREVGDPTGPALARVVVDAGPVLTRSTPSRTQGLPASKPGLYAGTHDLVSTVAAPAGVAAQAGDDRYSRLVRAVSTD
ncbi:hypothetical protein Adi01nite_12190 [Amorphoplanes digitatis]|nr:hypothetical protein Adi01nite_12190 [Actinoplanes digitatis]